MTEDSRESYPAVCLLFLHVVADNAADDCAADRSYCAPSREDGSTDGADSRTYGSVLILPRHAGTTTQKKQRRDGAKHKLTIRFHGVCPFEEFVFPIVAATAEAVHGLS
jgi:hypothetical protein